VKRLFGHKTLASKELKQLRAEEANKGEEATTTETMENGANEAVKKVKVCTTIYNYWKDGAEII
jgi:hypothetical protein